MLARSGYERSFALNATPELIDQMIADLRHRPSNSRFEQYALVVYYMRRPATTDHLDTLRGSQSEEVRQIAEKFTEAISNFTKANQSP